MNCFVADVPGPPRRRFYIYGDPPAARAGEVSGWSFVVDQYDESGEAQPYFDTWEERFAEILRYPPEYSEAAFVWRREGTDEIVDLMSLSFGDRI